MKGWLKPGEMKRFVCQDCDTAFELRLEPEAAAEDVLIPEQEALYCPFCLYEGLDEA